MFNQVTIELAERTLKALYPDVDLSAVEWEWEEEGAILEAEFTIDGHSYEVEIDVSGEHLATESDVTIEDLPMPVLLQIKEMYPEFSIVEAEQVDYPAKTIYEMELTDEDGHTVTVLFRPDGKVIIPGPSGTLYI
jgi:hypothetical protein